MDPEYTLMRLGFDQKSALVYITLLSKGDQTATELANHSGIDRTSIYHIVRRLQSKGLVSLHKHRDKQYFAAADPESLYALFDEQASLCRQMLPALHKLQKGKKKNVSLQLYRGFAGLRTLIQSLGPETKELYILGEQGQFKKLYPEYAHAYLHKLLEHRIKEKVLARHDQRGKIKGGKHSTIRYLPMSFDSPSTAVIAKDFIIITQWDKPVVNVLIRSSDIARSYLAAFRELWKVAKP